MKNLMMKDRVAATANNFIHLVTCPVRVVSVNI
ncbi:hypothetical protein FIU87_06200 [Bacillus sp. THAF10]|nr:hypothetical protein FIU87_06200 [Bacillus sp. THAF10]